MTLDFKSIIEFIGLIFTILTTGIGTAWFLSVRISTLDTRLTTMQAKEEARDEKINKMWDWWLEALHSGFTSYNTNKKDKP